MPSEKSVVTNNPVAVCEMNKGSPAIVMEPTRGAVAAFVATLNVTNPLPAPGVPPVTVSHAALLTAVHAHEAPLETVIVPLPLASVAVAVKTLFNNATPPGSVAENVALSPASVVVLTNPR